MKLTRTKQYYFGWMVMLPLLDVVFLLLFFLLVSSNFILQPGINISLPFSRFQLAPQLNQQIVSITGGAVPTIYFRDQKITLVIKADRLTPYETVAAVTNAALEHGITSVALAGAAAR